jgi:4-alpha-glucanotransferase
VKEALEVLGIRNFLLGLHDPAFPSLPEEDIGRGSPYSHGAGQFLRFVRDLGFDGIQLGPQGITTPVNPSPYDGTLFSRNPLSLAPLRLSSRPWEILNPEKLARLASERPTPATLVHRPFTAKAMEYVLKEVRCWYRKMNSREETPPRGADLLPSFVEFRRWNADWLERDALYEILRQCYGGRNWKEWGEDDQARIDQHLHAPPAGLEKTAQDRMVRLRTLHGPKIEEYCFIQYLLHEQHREFRERCRLLGLKLFGDCQIGLSGRDAWSAKSFVLPGYLLGAPPSRTNPTGQPWNYPLLDPRHYYLADREPGPALRFFRARIDKLFAEFDGLRIDHPHGLICPWVYRAGQPDQIEAVQAGARLFASPELADHPDLARFAIARPDQLNSGTNRYADDWVMSLEPEQIRRYAELFEVIMDSARANCRGVCEIACEILSTQPYPVRKVMEIHGLGRFRVTQKADLDDPNDGYRSENARPEDWLMLGNHDTPSIWQAAEAWIRSGISGQQAAYLAGRLRIPEAERTEWTARTAADAGRLAQAKFADLLIGPATNIMVFFTDLLGIDRPYNQPGTISEENWALRIAPDFQAQYTARSAAGRALNLPGALAMALRARRDELDLGSNGLIEVLEEPSEG